MKKTGKITAILLSILLLGACSSKENMNTEKGEMTEMTENSVLNQEFMDTNGKSFRLSDLKGKKVYIKFWASWCPICLAGLPDVNNLAAKQGDDFVVLSVAAPGYKGEQTKEDFTKWFKTLEYKSLPVLLDSEGMLLKEYEILSYPTSVFIDSEGNLAEKRLGHMSVADIEKTLKDVR